NENYRVRMLLSDTQLIEKVDDAWQHNLKGNGITVAVIDTGIDDSHPDLAGIVVDRQNFTQEAAGDKVGHGTHVSSIVAGRGVADVTKKGLAHGCNLL